MKNDPCILCLDIGTSACKGGLFDRSGNALKTARVSYPFLPSEDVSKVEQDPETIWSAIETAIQELASHHESASRIAAISLSAQMSTHMLVDRQNAPLSHFLSWADSRAELESEELVSNFSPELLIQELGAKLPPAPSWPLPKLKWWMRHEPALIEHARYLVQPKDWIIWKLTGRWITDLSSLRGIRHQKTGSCSQILMDWCGVRSDIILPYAQPDDIAGTLCPEWAKAWKLRADTPVIVGLNDLAAAVIGVTGLTNKMKAFDITGTSEQLGVCIPESDASFHASALSQIPLLDNHILRYGVTSSSGSILNWYQSQFSYAKRDEDWHRAFQEALETLPAGSDGLLFLPYLYGERAPWFNPKASGAFVGIHSGHTNRHFTRAVIEGITYNLQAIYHRLGAEDIKEMYVIGGSSISKAWNQLKADVFQVRLVVPECLEAGCLGAAILASHALGWHASITEAAKVMIRTAAVYEPDVSMANFFQEQCKRFEALYHALHPAE